MTRTSVNSRECICHGKLAIVMAVNPDRNTHSSYDLTRDEFYVVRKTATVRVTKYDARRTCLGGNEQGLQGILGIRSISVKEVLRVINHERHGSRKLMRRIRDDFEILFETNPRRLANVQFPCLAENSNDGRVCFA